MLGGRWVTARSPGATAPRIRLFCLPYGGSGASVFHGWQEALPAEIEVCPVTLPGRDARISEPPATRIRDLVRALALGLEPMLDLPFALFGHSLGALVAFELARELRRRARPRPATLFASACRAPQLRSSEPALHQLPDARLVERIRSLGGTPEAVWDNPELVELVLPVLRADFEAAETYDHVEEPPLDCAIVALGGLEDTHVVRADLVEWRTQTTGRFDVLMLPGDHFFLRSSRTALLDALGRMLATPR